MILVCYLPVMFLAIPALKAPHLEATSALLQRCWSVCGITPSNTTAPPGKPFRYFIKIILHRPYIFICYKPIKGECFGWILSLYQLVPLPRKHLWCCLYYSYVSPSFIMIGTYLNKDFFNAGTTALRWRLGVATRIPSNCATLVDLAQDTTPGSIAPIKISILKNTNENFNFT